MLEPEPEPTPVPAPRAAHCTYLGWRVVARSEVNGVMVAITKPCFEDESGAVFQTDRGWTRWEDETLRLMAAQALRRARAAEVAPTTDLAPSIQQWCSTSDFEDVAVEFWDWPRDYARQRWQHIYDRLLVSHPTHVSDLGHIKYVLTCLPVLLP